MVGLPVFSFYLSMTDLPVQPIVHGAVNVEVGHMKIPFGTPLEIPLNEPRACFPPQTGLITLCLSWGKLMHCFLISAAN